MILITIVSTVIAYLLGSIPSGVVVARVFGWPDPRSHDSEHTGGLNSWRGGGIPALLLVTLLDAGKGALAVWVAAQLAPGVVALAGAAVVAGHCWSVYIGFKGGMGLATAAGTLVTYNIVVVLVAGVAWLLLTRVMMHKARAVMLVMAAVPVLLWLLDANTEVLWLGIATAAVIFVRHIADWNREYE